MTKQVINILTPKIEKHLLGLSRKALEYYFNSKKEMHVDQSQIPFKSLFEKRETFVTLTKNDQLRGCIGHIHAVQEIYKDVIDNTYAAAFNDPRFPSLSKDELKDIKIEISILSTPEKLEYSGTKQLLSTLDANRPGVIIQKGFNNATFLPQVWEELKNPSEFLSHLCIKAGLPPNDWTNDDLTIFTYDVEKVKEK